MPRHPSPGVFAQQGLPADIQQRERREHGGAVVSGALARHQSRVLEGVGQARRGQVRTMVDLMMVVLMCFELRVRYRVESPSGDVFRDGFDTFAVRLWDSVMACGPENKPFVEFRGVKGKKWPLEPANAAIGTRCSYDHGN